MPETNDPRDNPAQQPPWSAEGPETKPVSCANSGRLIGAVFLICAGIALFLNNIGLLPIHNIWRFWPLFLIAIGVGKLYGSRTSQDRAWGIIAIVFGLLFLGSNLHVFMFHFKDGTWIIGLVLVAAGFASLAGMLDPAWHAVRFDIRQRKRMERYARRQYRRDLRRGFPADAFTTEGVVSERLIHEEAVFSSIKRRVITDAFEGGSIQSVFGSVELDLRLASVPSGTAGIEVNCVFGSIKLTIPSNWRVSLRVAGGFGSVEDKTLPLTRTDIGGPMLIVNGSSVFGSVEVVN
ncbi:MAG TPA: DUF5668 domain-containing protein [Bryobacteraceae bacterium]|jgi:predicted membrane protein|nr:DUF5668 domain-containing protein [Bryobacteraceae bacterium]